MGQTERNQSQAVEHSRDAQPPVAGGETEALPVPGTRGQTQPLPKILARARS
jgi:hypothetical protein